MLQSGRAAIGSEKLRGSICGGTASAKSRIETICVIPVLPTRPAYRTKEELHGRFGSGPFDCVYTIEEGDDRIGDTPPGRPRIRRSFYLQ